MAVGVFGSMLERRFGWFPMLAIFLAAGAAGAEVAILADFAGPFESGPFYLVLGRQRRGARAARGLAGRRPPRRRRGNDRENDLLGVYVFAAVLLLLPLAVEEASAVAGVVGAATGAVLGLALPRVHTQVGAAAGRAYSQLVAAAEPPFSDEELDRAVEALSDPERFRAAEARLTRVAPQLQRILNEALMGGGWLGDAQEQQVRQATGHDGQEERMTAVTDPPGGGGPDGHAGRRRGRLGAGARAGDRQELTDRRYPMDIRFLGQSCFELSDGDTRLLIDPFLTGNPKAAVEASEVEPTHILLTHGHADHLGDTVEIAQAHRRAGDRDRRAGERDRRATASRTSSTPTSAAPSSSRAAGCASSRRGTRRSRRDGTPHIAGRARRSSLGGKIVYHLGDTTLFSDLALPGKRDDLDVALVPIGGHYTMDRHDAVEAVKLVGAPTVIPCHYDTFPPIETDAAAFKSDVETDTGSSVVVLEPGDTHSV